MAAPTALSEETTAAELRAAYGIEVLAFAPVAGGADLANAVFRVTAAAGSFCVKVRTAPSNIAALALARLFADSGIGTVVAPIATCDGRLAHDLGGRRLTVYPWVDGVPATTQPMRDSQWEDLGRSLRNIHDTVLSDALAAALRKEQFGAHWREQVGEVLAHPPAAASSAGGDLCALLRSNAEPIRDLVEFADRFAALLGHRAHALVPCHGDLHAANVLLDGSRVHIVDWDDPLLAPHERDLMFIGAGVCGVWKGDEGSDAFRRGYGPVETDPALLAYYRCERIVEDIAVTCGEIFDEAGDPERQKQVLQQLADQFAPGNVVDIALKTASDSEAA